jgi:S1-C subfamily serine protease
MRQPTLVRVITIITFILAIFLSGAATALALFLPHISNYSAYQIPTAQPTPTLPPNTVFSEVEAIDQVLINLYERVSPSVLHITSYTQSIGFYGIEPNEGTGSGFVLDTEGHVVTNNHVIAGADEVEVILANGSSLPAKVIGADEYYDLAVLKSMRPLIPWFRWKWAIRLACASGKR